VAWKPDNYTLVDASNPNRRTHIRVTTDQMWMAPFKTIPDGWAPQPNLAGEWYIDSDGTLVGKVDGDEPSILWCNQPLDGDHMIEFQACALPPNDNDISAIWEGTGEYDGTDPAKFCTIGGIGGWWRGYSGIERSLGNETGASGRFITKSGDLIIGQIHNIAAGRAGKHDFLFVNGKLVQQVSQQDAPRRPQSRVALTTWNSAIKIYCIRISTITMSGGYDRYANPGTA